MYGQISTNNAGLLLLVVLVALLALSLSMIVLFFVFIGMMKVIGNKNGKRPVVKTNIR